MIQIFLVSDPLSHSRHFSYTMGWWEDQLPAIAMVSMQLLVAVMALMNRAALLEGMSPKVFIFYRQAIATLVISPFAFCPRRKSNGRVSTMTTKSFVLIFITSFIGVVLYQNMYFQGLFLASSSMASATSNLTPAVTFLIAALLRLEQVNMKAMTSIAKIVGTIICVGGAISMALFKGPKILNTQLPPSNSLVLSSFGGDINWLIGCLWLFGSSSCWSLWLIMQVAVTACYPDHLSLSAWTCLMSTFQAGIIAFILEKDPNAWNFSSSALQLGCCFFSGVFGSAVQFFVQSWCISRRGPLYSAMFNPLCTVITTVLAFIFLKEELHVGSLLGAIAVMSGLYVVLWGKSEELKASKLDPAGENYADTTAEETISDKIDLEKPLLIDECNINKADERL
ncbi:WAT1-related protein At4g30420-like [Silene latifolia]|uniref:WAT1-related protein At4g30420-like n=1 Tax=Silene latifolia TaxID=37657 RepID=UPI003D781404